MSIHNSHNFNLSNVTIRVSRDGHTSHGWKWQLLDFFKLEVAKGPPPGVRMTQYEARQAGSEAKVRYFKSLKIIKVKLVVDAKKSISSTALGRKWDKRPALAPRTPQNHRCPGS